MADPANLDEYNRLYMERFEVEGFGIEGTTQHFPCPFCAAQDWLVVRLIDFGDTRSPITCDHCGRTGQIVVERRPGEAAFEIIQTDGADPPEWLEPAPRRAEAVPVDA